MENDLSAVKVIYLLSRYGFSITLQMLPIASPTKQTKNYRCCSSRPIYNSYINTHISRHWWGEQGSVCKVWRFLSKVFTERETVPISHYRVSSYFSSSSLTSARSCSETLPTMHRITVSDLSLSQAQILLPGHSLFTITRRREKEKKK